MQWKRTKRVARTEANPLSFWAFLYYPRGSYDMGRPKQRWKEAEDPHEKQALRDQTCTCT